MKKLLILVILLLSQNIRAQEIKPDDWEKMGGDALVCDDGTVQLLEYWYARQFVGPIDTVPGLKTVDEKLTYMLDKLKKLDDKRYPELKHAYQTVKDSKFEHLTGIEFVNFPEWTDYPIPNNCEVQQVVLYQTSWPRRTLINKDLYDKMSLDDQAGAMLNAVLRETEGHIDYGWEIRNWSILLGTQLLNNVSLADYINIYLPIVKRPYEYKPWSNGLWTYGYYFYGNVKFYPSGNIASGSVDGSLVFSFDKEGEPCGNTLHNTDDGVVELHDDDLSTPKRFKSYYSGHHWGALQYLDGTTGICVRLINSTSALGHAVKTNVRYGKNPVYELYDNGQLVSAEFTDKLTPEDKLDLTVATFRTFKEEMYAFIGKVEFYRSGVVKAGTLFPKKGSEYVCDDQTKLNLMTTSGERKDFGCVPLKFDEQGRVIL